MGINASNGSDVADDAANEIGPDNITIIHRTWKHSVGLTIIAIVSFIITSIMSTMGPGNAIVMQVFVPLFSAITLAFTIVFARLEVNLFGNDVKNNNYEDTEEYKEWCRTREFHNSITIVVAIIIVVFNILLAVLANAAFSATSLLMPMFVAIMFLTHVIYLSMDTWSGYHIAERLKSKALQQHSV